LTCAAQSVIVIVFVTPTRVAADTVQPVDIMSNNC
jgi:hypothetical protein